MEILFIYLIHVTDTKVMKIEGKEAKRPFKGDVITRNQILGGLKMVTILVR